MIYVWLQLSLNKISEPTHFHAYVVNIVGLFLFYLQWMLFNLCLCLWTISFAFVWILLNVCCCINSSLLTCGLFHILSCDVIMLVCSFQAMYYYRLLRGALYFPLYVLEPSSITLDSPQVHAFPLTQSYHTYLYMLLRLRNYTTTHYWDSYSK